MDANNSEALSMEQVARTSRQVLVADLEQSISRASPQRCAEMLMHITDLFVVGSAKFSEPESAVFDDVISRLAREVDIAAKSMLARRLAAVGKAPVNSIRLLADDDEIKVAQPILASCGQLDNESFLYLARTKSQDHLLAISQRKSLSEEVADALIERGSQQVLLDVSNNPEVKPSEAGFALLVKRCEDDDVLAKSIGSRPDIPQHLFQKLFATASEVVRTNFVAANIPIKQEYSLTEPVFLFSGNGQALLAV